MAAAVGYTLSAAGERSLQQPSLLCLTHFDFNSDLCGSSRDGEVGVVFSLRPHLPGLVRHVHIQILYIRNGYMYM